MSLSIITAPTEEPLTTEEVRTHVRPPDDESEAELLALLTSARRFAEVRMNRAYARTGFRYSLSHFPSTGIIELPRPPLVSVESIEYTDTDGATQVLDPATYVVDTANEPGRVWRAYGATWPTEVRQEGTPDPVRVNYTAGYNTDTVPAEVVLALKLLTAHYYENREAVAAKPMPELPFGIEALLSSDSWGAVK